MKRDIKAIVILLLLIAFLLIYGGHRMRRLEADNKTLKAANEKLIRASLNPMMAEGDYLAAINKPDDYIMCGALKPQHGSKQDWDLDLDGAHFWDSTGKEISAKEWAAQNRATVATKPEEGK